MADFENEEGNYGASLTGVEDSLFMDESQLDLNDGSIISDEQSEDNREDDRNDLQSNAEVEAALGTDKSVPEFAITEESTTQASSDALAGFTPIDLDAVDTRIDELYRKGISSVTITQKLNTEYKLSWSIETVRRRYRHFLAARRTLHDAELDAVNHDWHKSDDAKLKQLYQQSEQWLEARIQKLKQQRWDNISDGMLDENGSRMWSSRGLRARIEGTAAGPMLPPYEDDPDLEARAAIRANETAYHRSVLDTLRKSREVKKQREMQEQVRTAELRRKRLQDAQLKSKLKKEALVARGNDKKRRDDAQVHNEAFAQWVRDRVATETIILGRLPGRFRPKYLTTKRKRSHIQPGDSPVRTPSTAGKRVKVGSPAVVTRQTLENPRSVMNIEELQALLHSRDLPPRGEEEDHAHLVARLAAADETSTATELNDLLVSRLLKQNGSSAAKARRIQEHDAKHSIAGETGATATSREFKQGYSMYARYGFEPMQ